MSSPPALKTVLKRGALLAAANWPLVAVQFIAEGTLKLLLAVPIVGGVFLVVLVLGADAEQVLSGDAGDIATTVFGLLRANPAGLTAFAASALIVLIGASALTFVVKCGTVTVLADAEAAAGPIERPPLRLAALRRANVTAIGRFLDGCTRLWRRYLKLGACLLVIYAITAAAYIAFVVGGYSLVGNSGVLLGWGVAAFVASSALIVWITLINFFYLLTQIAIAVDDTGVRGGVARVIEFLRSSLREIAGIFGVVLVLVVIATVASILATAGLGLIAFVPLAGLAVVPLQVAAWLLRGVVFQYLALAALGAYLTHYRHYLRGRAATPARETSPADFQGKRFA
jgi:hypothetical protein